jgi:hypothetical protein
MRGSPVVKIGRPYWVHVSPSSMLSKKLVNTPLNIFCLLIQPFFPPPPLRCPPYQTCSDVPPSPRPFSSQPLRDCSRKSLEQSLKVWDELGEDSG